MTVCGGPTSSSSPKLTVPGPREFCDNLRSISAAESAGSAGSFDVAYAEDVVWINISLILILVVSVEAN